MSTPALNVIIWLSVKPIIKLVIPAGAGYFLTRASLFPVSGSRAASQIILNVTLPSLLFSKIVPSLNSSNISALGPIVLVALVYMGLSMIFGVVTRALFPCPRNFRWGIVAAATWANWGDLPTSVVATVTLSAPFNGTEDSNLAIAYVAIFILVFYITLFPLGGTRLIQKDYENLPEQDEESAEHIGPGPWSRLKSATNHLQNVPSLIKRRVQRRPRPSVNALADELNDDKESSASPTTASNALPESSNGGFPDLRRMRSSRQPAFGTDLRRVATTRSIGGASLRELAGAAAAASFEDTGELSRKYSMGRDKRAAEERAKLQTIVGSRPQSVFDDADEITDSGTACEPTTSTLPELNESRKEDGRSAAAPPPDSLAHRVLLASWSFFRSLFTPPTISLISGLVIALVPKLKAIFVYVPGASFNPTAPDGDPPLGIILDSATFIGAASVPLGLLVLGAALSRMRIPHPISRLPLASIVCLALLKLVLLPVVGFLLVHALTFHTSLVPPENIVLRFTLIYFACVPTATTQVALTQIYCPEDGPSNSDILASYLIFQYAVFVLSSVVLTAYTLSSF